MDVPVATTLISTGDESSALIMPGSPLSAGNYSLALSLQRTRWETTTTDPQSMYHDEATIPLAW